MPSRSADTWPRIAVSGVRSSCETDMRKLRDSCSDSASFAAMSRKRADEMRDLVRAARRGQLDAVVPAATSSAACESARSGSRDAPREVEAEQARDDDAAAERDPEPFDERHRAAAQLRRRLRDDERAEQVVAELQRPRDCQVAASAER